MMLDSMPVRLALWSLLYTISFDGRVLRHAMVKVSMGPGPAAAPESAPAEGN